MDTRENVTRIVDMILRAREARHKNLPRPEDVPAYTMRSVLNSLVKRPKYPNEFYYMQCTAVYALLSKMRTFQLNCLRYPESEIDMKTVREKTIDLIVKIVED